MFTGIIKAMGWVKKKTKKEKGLLLSVGCPAAIAKRLETGSSISVNGVCTTVTTKDKDWFKVYLMPETLKVTTLGALGIGEPVNLEPSLRMGDELGGHFVLGHVDGVDKVYKVRKVKSDMVIAFRPPPKLTPFIVRKGSVAIDGVSLTVVDVDKKTFTVALIPYTIKNTTLGQKRAGDKVNIEVDVLARYIFKK